jgi:S1-C subfamily serine protease
VEEKLGLQAGDVVLSFGGEEVSDPVWFLRKMKDRPKDDPPRELKVRRGGETVAVRLPAGSWKTLVRPVLPDGRALDGGGW